MGYYILYTTDLRYLDLENSNLLNIMVICPASKSRLYRQAQDSRAWQNIYSLVANYFSKSSCTLLNSHRVQWARKCKYRIKRRTSWKVHLERTISWDNFSWKVFKSKISITRTPYERNGKYSIVTVHLYLKLVNHQKINKYFFL